MLSEWRPLAGNVMKRGEAIDRRPSENKRLLLRQKILIEKILQTFMILARLDVFLFGSLNL